jgi:hypothetical protein
MLRQNPAATGPPSITARQLVAVIQSLGAVERSGSRSLGGAELHSSETGRPHSERTKKNGLRLVSVSRCSIY